MLDVPKNLNLLKEWQSRNGRTYGPGPASGVAYPRDLSPNRIKGMSNTNTKTPMQYREYGGYDPMRSNYYDRFYQNYNPYDRDSMLLMSGIHGGGTLVQPFGPMVSNFNHHMNSPRQHKTLEKSMTTLGLGYSDHKHYSNNRAYLLREKMKKRQKVTPRNSNSNFFNSSSDFNFHKINSHGDDDSRMPKLRKKLLGPSLTAVPGGNSGGLKFFDKEKLSARLSHLNVLQQNMNSDLFRKDFDYHPLVFLDKNDVNNNNIEKDQNTKNSLLRKNVASNLVKTKMALEKLNRAANRISDRYSSRIRSTLFLNGTIAPTATGGIEKEEHDDRPAPLEPIEKPPLKFEKSNASSRLDSKTLVSSDGVSFVEPIKNSSSKNDENLPSNHQMNSTNRKLFSRSTKKVSKAFKNLVKISLSAATHRNLKSCKNSKIPVLSVKKRASGKDSQSQISGFTCRSRNVATNTSFNLGHSSDRDVARGNMVWDW